MVERVTGEWSEMELEEFSLTTSICPKHAHPTLFQAQVVKTRLESEIPLITIKKGRRLSTPRMLIGAGEIKTLVPRRRRSWRLPINRLGDEKLTNKFQDYGRGSWCGAQSAFSRRRSSSQGLVLGNFLITHHGKKPKLLISLSLPKRLNSVLCPAFCLRRPTGEIGKRVLCPFSASPFITDGPISIHEQDLMEMLPLWYSVPFSGLFWGRGAWG